MPKSTIQAYINYYTACYRADNRVYGIHNVLKNNLELYEFIPEPDLLEGKLERYPIKSKIGQKWNKQLLLYAKDKQLVGSFFTLQIDSKNRFPIFLFPCKLVTIKQDFYLKASFEKAYLNPFFIRYLKTISNEEEVDHIQYKLSNIANFSADKIFDIQVLLQKYLPDLDDKYIYNYPKLFLKTDFTRLSKKAILPHFSVGLIRRSLDVRAILNEFDVLEKAQDYSAPLKALIGESRSRNKKAQLPLFSAFTLSQSQAEVCRSCMQFALSTMAGPPGTGKSFTIAAIALNAAIQGKSVLISSKTNAAVDVIAEKLKKDFSVDPIFMRGGIRENKRILKSKLNVFKRVLKSSSNENSNDKYILKEIKNQRALLKSNENQLFKQLNAEQSLSNHLVYGSKHFIQDWWSRWKLSKIPNRKTSIELIKSNKEIYKRLRFLEKQFIQARLFENLRKDKRKNGEKIRSFTDSISARTNERQQQLHQQINFDHLLSILPIWLIALPEIGQVFPMQKEQFDLLILDEASQIDLASALPALQRAKHAIVIGDKMQLKHVSFLSHQKESSLLKLHLSNHTIEEPLNYRSSSLLDLVNRKVNNDQASFYLDEHFRSHPSIINFSNHEYYGGHLKLMKKNKKEASYGIHFKKLNGKRTKDGINHKEAVFIVNKVKSIIRSHKGRSIGVISPFRKQVDYIRKLMEQEIKLVELTLVNLKVDTPFGFQGDERDEVFISLVFDNDAERKVRRYLNTPGVFNVTITRAKEKQTVIHSFDPAILSKNSILRKYFQYQHVQENNYLNAYSDEFLDEVLSFLMELNISDININKSIGDIIADLYFEKNGQSFVMDLVGYPGEQTAFNDINAYQVFERMNAIVLVVPYSSWIMDQPRIKSQIKKIVLS